MRIDEARTLLDQIEKISSNVDILIVVPKKDIESHLNDFDFRPVLQTSAWNAEEVVFKDKKVDLQNQKTSYNRSEDISS